MEKTCILIVDDVPENIDILANLLGDEYELKAAINGKKPWTLLKAIQSPI